MIDAAQAPNERLADPLLQPISIFCLPFVKPTLLELQIDPFSKYLYCRQPLILPILRRPPEQLVERCLRHPCKRVGALFQAIEPMERTSLSQPLNKIYFRKPR